MQKVDKLIRNKVRCVNRVHRVIRETAKGIRKIFEACGGRVFKRVPEGTGSAVCSVTNQLYADVLHCLNEVSAKYPDLRIATTITFSSLTVQVSDRYMIASNPGCLDYIATYVVVQFTDLGYVDKRDAEYSIDKDPALRANWKPAEVTALQSKYRKLSKSLDNVKDAGGVWCDPKSGLIQE